MQKKKKYNTDILSNCVKPKLKSLKGTQREYLGFLRQDSDYF